MTLFQNEISGSEEKLIVRQLKEWTEIVIDLETRNKYEILDETLKPIGFIAERSGGVLDTIKRLLLRSHRPLSVDVLDGTGQKALLLTRPFFWIFSTLNIHDSEGRTCGLIDRRFALFHKKYDLKDETGSVFARISSPFWKIWTFPIFRTGRLNLASQAAISKKWSGALREVFTDSDTYQIDFGQEHWNPSQKAVILAAAISIDFDYFENNQGSRGFLSLID